PRRRPRARPVARLACSSDSPQGLLKKIELHLLLADLALQLDDALARPHKILRLEIGRSKSLARSTGQPQRLRSTPAEMSALLVKKAGRNPELARQRSHALPRYHPLY